MLGSIWAPQFCEECVEGFQRQAAEKEAAQRAARVRDLLTQSELSPEYVDGSRTLEIVEREIRGRLGKQAAETILGAIRGFRSGEIQFPGLYLGGKAGRWKTSIAQALLAEAITARMEDGAYLLVPEFLSQLRDTYSGDYRGPGEYALISKYGASSYLVLDDMGKERPTEHAALTLFKVLDRRYRFDLHAHATARGSRWLIVTSNYTLGDLEARLARAVGTEIAEPIARRISELCITVRID